MISIATTTTCLRKRRCFHKRRCFRTNFHHIISHQLPPMVLQEKVSTPPPKIKHGQPFRSNLQTVLYRVRGRLAAAYQPGAGPPGSAATVERGLGRPRTPPPARQATKKGVAILTACRCHAAPPTLDVHGWKLLMHDPAGQRNYVWVLSIETLSTNKVFAKRQGVC